MNGFKWNPFGNQQAKPPHFTYGRNYLRLDGTPADSNLIVRFMTMPAIQSGVLVNMLSAAMSAMTKPEYLERNEFASQLVSDIPSVLFGVVVYQFFLAAGTPVPLHSLIDTKGAATKDKYKAMVLASYYESTGKIFAAVATLLYLANGIASRNFSDVGALAPLGPATWHLIAANRLASGRWTLDTSPERPEPPSSPSKPANRL